MHRLGPTNVALAGLVFLTAGVWGNDYTQRVDVTQSSRQGCMRSTLERTFTATKDAADAIRERSLATTNGEPEHLAHALSARNAEAAARGLLDLAGVPSAVPMDTVAVMDPQDPDVAAMRRAFCDQAFPSASLIRLP